MYELLEKYSGAQLFAREKNSFELERFLKYSMDLFYDKDTEMCIRDRDFDGDGIADHLYI